MTPSTIQDLTEAIWEHWVIHRDVPVDVADAMRTELSEHLADALADGKTIEQVVGLDLREFADEWATDHDEPPSRARTAIAFLGAGLTGIAGWVAVNAVVQGTMGPTVLFGELLVFVTVSTALAFLSFGRQMSRLRRGPRPFPSHWYQFLVGAVFGAILIGSVAVFDSVGLSPWPVSVAAPLTLLAFVAAGFLLVGPIVGVLRSKAGR